MRNSPGYSLSKVGLVAAGCLGALGLTGAMTGCGPEVVSVPARSELGSNEVARVAGRSVTVEVVEKELSRRSPGTAKEVALDAVLHFEATLAKARAAGFDREPETAQAIERLLVARYEEREARDQEAPSVGDEEVRLYYEANPGRFTIPAARRASILFTKLSPKASPEHRTQALKLAEELRSAAEVADEAGRDRLVRENSEDQASRYRGGDTGWIEEGQVGAVWEPAVLEALRALAKPGDFAPVVVTSRGLHVIRLTALRDQAVRPLAEVKEVIRRQLQGELRARRAEAFRARMREGLTIETNRSALDRIQERTVRELRPPALP